MEKVSAIMPVYNRERYLAAAIESVLNQTYKNIELIIVDDGSSDLSLSIAQKYSNMYPDKIRVLAQSNQGPSNARNNAIKCAEGEIIAFIDSDDLWSPDKIELQIEKFREHPNAGFIYSGYYTVNDTGDFLRECLPDKTMEGFLYDKLWTLENNISGGTILVAKNKLLESGGFDEDLKGAENLDLRMRLSILGEVFFVNKCLYHYRKHDSNLTTDFSAMSDCQLSLIDKHFGKTFTFSNSMYRRVMSKYHYKNGANEFSNMKLLSAIPHFCRAIALSPFNVECYLRLFRCCLGVNINKALSRLMH